MEDNWPSGWACCRERWAGFVSGNWVSSVIRLVTTDNLKTLRKENRSKAIRKALKAGLVSFWTLLRAVERWCSGLCCTLQSQTEIDLVRGSEAYGRGLWSFPRTQKLRFPMKSYNFHIIDNQFLFLRVYLSLPGFPNWKNHGSPVSTATSHPSQVFYRNWQCVLTFLQKR